MSRSRVQRMGPYAIDIDQVWVRADAQDQAGTTARLAETVLPRLADLTA